MIGWIFGLLLAGGVFLAWQRSRRQMRACAEHLARQLDDLAAGRAPDPQSMPAGPCSALFADRLDRLAEEQRRWRERVDRAESNHQTVLSCMEEGLMVVDARHVLGQTNPSFLKLFDLKADPRGQSVLRTLREPQIEEMVRDALQTALPQSRELSLNGPRAARHFAVHAVPMRDDAGQPGVVTVFRDISRLRQLEDVRRDFVANVSHELRTPLAIFHGYLENLMDEPRMPRAQQAEIFAIITKHSQRLNALLEDLLILARLESRHENLVFESILLPAFLGEIHTAWQGRARKKGVTLSMAVNEPLPALEADRLRLEQVLNNLLENALKYTEAGGRIEVGAQSLGDEVEVRVTDSGIGIPPADLPHIFERFYRADKARTREHGGTGLGLSIVKHIVQSHGGSVFASSTYEKGSTISFRLPAPPLTTSPLTLPTASPVCGAQS